jgi:FtsH-binding integral membrane protein
VLQARGDAGLAHEAGLRGAAEPEQLLDRDGAIEPVVEGLVDAAEAAAAELLAARVLRSVDAIEVGVRRGRGRRRPGDVPVVDGRGQRRPRALLGRGPLDVVRLGARGRPSGPILAVRLDHATLVGREGEMSDQTLRREAMLASEAPLAARQDFIRKTYAHLAAAVFVFMALVYLIVESPLGMGITRFALGNGRLGWLAILGAFIFVGWVADRWSRSTVSPGMQYLGLGLYVAAEAVIFTPILYLCTYLTRYEGLIQTAGIITGILFAGLTAVVFLTRADFSWMRGLLAAGGLVAFGVLVTSAVFGFHLGVIYSGAVVLLAGGYILYYTSNVLHRYPIGFHVSAALALFSAVALMFWYVLRILMSSRR